MPLINHTPQFLEKQRLRRIKQEKEEKARLEKEIKETPESEKSKDFSEKEINEDLDYSSLTITKLKEKFEFFSLKECLAIREALTAIRQNKEFCWKTYKRTPDELFYLFDSIIQKLNQNLTFLEHTQRFGVKSTREATINDARNEIRQNKVLEEKRENRKKIKEYEKQKIQYENEARQVREAKRFIEKLAKES